MVGAVISRRNLTLVLWGIKSFRRRRNKGPPGGPDNLYGVCQRAPSIKRDPEGLSVRAVLPA